MNDDVRKELLYDLTNAVNILGVKEEKDYEELKNLSEHSIEDVALHKDVDLVAISVLIYSIYKIVHDLDEKMYNSILAGMKTAKKNMEEGKLGSYNRSIKSLFILVKKAHAKVKEHLEEVMDAARIKKGTSLLQKGLSIGQAAGMMGLSNWDLQQYAGRTTALSQHHERIKASLRLEKALKLFGVK